MAIPISERTHLKLIETTFSFIEFVSACKLSVHSIGSFLRYSQFQSCDQIAHAHFWPRSPKTFLINF